MNNRQWKSLGLAYFALVALLTPHAGQRLY